MVATFSRPSPGVWKLSRRSSTGSVGWWEGISLLLGRLPFLASASARFLEQWRRHGYDGWRVCGHWSCVRRHRGAFCSEGRCLRLLSCQLHPHLSGVEAPGDLPRRSNYKWHKRKGPGNTLRIGAFTGGIGEMLDMMLLSFWLIVTVRDLLEELLITAGADLEELAITAGADLEELPFTAGAALEALPITAGADLEALPITAGADLEELAITAGAALEEPPIAAGADLEELAITAGAALEEPPVTAGADLEELPITAGAALEALTITAGAALEALPITAGAALKALPTTASVPSDKQLQVTSSNRALGGMREK
ncbi:hypothetical protein P4O66_012694 [Electrophorus voltai]|uniref:Uncharacterized protein n=1 Tax=Electrophorus voltai TaxID=2609070 RepID=A0AAD9DTM1_9TELE|nr:hypothetical protein P4O66_012694 [Electrophorus voltai]